MSHLGKHDVTVHPDMSYKIIMYSQSWRNVFTVVCNWNHNEMLNS
jgi:hypothetical protein